MKAQSSKLRAHEKLQVPMLGLAPELGAGDLELLLSFEL
jgi:hypothetical protein